MKFRSILNIFIFSILIAGAIFTSSCSKENDKEEPKKQTNNEPPTSTFDLTATLIFNDGRVVEFEGNSVIPQIPEPFIADEYEGTRLITAAYQMKTDSMTYRIDIKVRMLEEEGTEYALYEDGQFIDDTLGWYIEFEMFNNSMDLDELYQSSSGHGDQSGNFVIESITEDRFKANFDSDIPNALEPDQRVIISDAKLDIKIMRIND